jgi:integrase
VQRVSFHTFRHTCASLLFAEDKNAKQVQEWLGHADPVTADPSRINAGST